MGKSSEHAVLIRAKYPVNNCSSKLTSKEAASRENTKDMDINVQGKNARVEYMEKGSFSMELLKHIDAASQSGFQCKVYCSLREDSR